MEEKVDKNDIKPKKERKRRNIFSGFFGKLLKAFIYITYPIILTIGIGLAVTLYLQTNELNEVNQTFIQARDQLNSENENKETTIEDLQVEYRQLTDEVKKLQLENDQLNADVENLSLSGFGSVSGSIIPFVTSREAGFSQYQRVCAENSDNKNKQYCVTVSAIDRDFSLKLPVGKYNVYSELFPIPDTSTPYAGVKAYYSTYVSCVQEKGEAECKPAQLTQPMEINIVAGSNQDNINPIDWR